MQNSQWFYGLLGALFVLSPSSAQAGPNPFDEVAEILASPAGKVLVREIGLSRAAISLSQAEEMALTLSEIRARYLRARPGDHMIFESSNGRVEPLTLRKKQELLLQAATLPELPKRIPVLLNKSGAKRLFSIARMEFEARFDPEQMIQLAQKLENGGYFRLTPEAKIELKTRRKEAAILRGAFAILSETHEVPAAIHAYARDFGKLNDAIENELPELVAQYASHFRKSVNAAGIRLALEKFAPTSRVSFERHLSLLLESIRAQAAESSLPLVKFHEMRKNLKEIMNFFFLSERVGSTPEIKAAYDFLYELNEDLGLMHDEMVAGSLRGEIEYDTQTIQVSRRLRNGIKRFLEKLDQAPPTK
jgi:hypothetical protein